MKTIEDIFEKLNLDPKEASVYTTLLELGPTAIRKIAERSKVNRGSVYEALKKLQKIGLVSYFHKGKRQHFVAEDPHTLTKILNRKKQDLDTALTNVDKIIATLETNKNTSGPIVKFFEDYSGVRSILEDVLNTMEKQKRKEYVVFSSSTLRPYLYHKDAFPDFTEHRIKRKIFVRTIANGPGGDTSGQDERKWLSTKESAPTYTLIYAGKVAMISVGENNTPHGLIIEDKEIYTTQLFIWNSLWDKLV